MANAHHTTSKDASLDWRPAGRCKGSTNPVEFEAYLEQFPNGVFRVLARARLAALRGSTGGATTTAGQGVGGALISASETRTSGAPSTSRTTPTAGARRPSGSPAVVAEGRPWSFDGDGALFRLVSEAQRIRLAHLFDPLLAVHTSVVDPLPHQITGVYEAMLPRQPLRFLLADDPGAGKTIMAGLLIKELIARGDLERCLIVCPGSLAEQWQDELFLICDATWLVATAPPQSGHDAGTGAECVSSTCGGRRRHPCRP